MTGHDAAVAKIRQLPEPLVQEVSDFIDFLTTRRDSTRWQLWTQFAEALEMGEADLAGYLSNLEEYEDRLSRGEIQW